VNRCAAALLAFVATSAAGGTPPPTCEGKISGSVEAKFTCTVVLETRADGATFFVVHGDAPIDGIPSYAPGAFEIPGPVEPGTYTFERLGMGRATVAAEGGTLYAASKTSGQRGEITLVLTSVKKDPQRKGAYVVHGTYRARLLAVGGGKTGEVVVDVRF
jgi:hypothetical protein